MNKPRITEEMKPMEEMNESEIAQTSNLIQPIVKETIGVGVNEKAVLLFYQTALSFTSISIFPW